MVIRILSAAVAVLMCGALVWVLASDSPPAAAPVAAAVATATARVERGDVTERVQVDGTLDFGGAHSVRNQLPAGILTATARTGSRIARGDRLFSVSGVPAYLLYGTTPAYRDFATGMAEGPDVRQLERNLVALGMDPYRAMTVDGHFTWATRAAIVRWQAARGVPSWQRTGTIPLGHVVFLPRGIRVERAVADVGVPVSPGARILVGTSNERVVTAQVDTDRRHLVHLGDRVDVGLPAGSGGSVAGRVTRIGRVAAAAQPGTPPRVPVTVALRLPKRARDLEQAPVRVAITSARSRDVLMVPVTALLARPGSGYQVRVVGGRAPRLVAVRPGLYDDDAGAVEVSGAGLREGMAVEVPAP